MDVLSGLFNSEYFTWLLGLVVSGSVVGVLIPVSFWLVGLVIDAFLQWLRAI